MRFDNRAFVVISIVGFMLGYWIVSYILDRMRRK